jgi:hypothetical protein
MKHSGILSVSLSDQDPVVGEAEEPRGRRYTLDGDRGLEQHLDRSCQRVLSGVRGLIPPEKLEAILLGGGYGRGEGGVLRDSAGDWPYNDLEFYIAIRGNRHLNELRYGHALEVLGQILTQLADVEVEFKITSLAEMRTQPVSMFSYDLFAGHRLLCGDALALTQCAQHFHAEQIPLSEATRLLMNRGTGLLLAKAKLGKAELSPHDADFIKRNIAKAALACGDAILTARGLYDRSCQTRHRQLERIARLEPSPWHEALLRHHAQGVEFKLHPDTTALSPYALAALHADVTELARQCWLWIEARRLNRPFSSARAYAQDAIDKCPETGRLRNIILNFRADRFRPALQPRPWRHPRQRIYHALALLLWDPKALKTPAVLSQLQRELRTPATTLAEMVRAYETLWQRVR